MAFLHRISALLLPATALFIGLPAWAGPLTKDVRICGFTRTYSRYGLPAPAIVGRSTSGQTNTFFRIQGRRNITQDLGNPTHPRFAAVADFISAVQISGTPLCIVGDIETRERTDKTLYYLFPDKFQTLDARGSGLYPSELAGDYQINGHSTARFSLRAVEDTDAGLVFFSEDFPRILTQELRMPCGVEALSTGVQRKDARTLTALVEVHCDVSGQGPASSITSRLEFVRTEKGGIVLRATATRPSDTRGLTLEFTQRAAHPFD